MSTKLQTPSSPHGAHVLLSAYGSHIQEQIYNTLTQDFGIHFSTIQVETKCFEGRSAEEIDFLKSNE